MNNDPQDTPEGLNDPIAISQCCGADHPMLEDIQLCPECGEHCGIEYIEAEE